MGFMNCFEILLENCNISWNKLDFPMLPKDCRKTQVSSCECDLLINGSFILWSVISADVNYRSKTPREPYLWVEDD